MQLMGGEILSNVHYGCITDGGRDLRKDQGSVEFVSKNIQPASDACLSIDLPSEWRDGLDQNSSIPRSWFPCSWSRKFFHHVLLFFYATWRGYILPIQFPAQKVPDHLFAFRRRFSRWSFSFPYQRRISSSSIALAMVIAVGECISIASKWG